MTMEWNNTPTIVLSLILIALLVGVGVLTLDKFAEGTKELETVTNESFTVPAVNSVVTLTEGGNITSLTKVLNASGDTWNSSQYSFDASTGKLNFTGDVQECNTSQTCYAYYSFYEYDTSAGTSLKASRDAVGDVSNSWLALIVTIIALTIIIGLVLRGFSFKGR